MSWTGRKQQLIRAMAVALFVEAAVLAAAADAAAQPGIAEVVRLSVKEGKIAFRLTTPEELRELTGPASQERKGREGDLETLLLEFPDLEAGFARVRELPGPFTLYGLKVKGRPLDIGRGRPIVLRNERDLKKIDPFWGLADVSLVKLDLRPHLQLLKSMSFNSLTDWPPRDRLPEGFDPARLLEDGRNPGLGLRKLHETGIDGRGVGIAIIDQPLLRDHEEFKDRVVRYEPVDVGDVPPQMHGAAVASIAVGKTCGVAPKAALYFFAVPTWKWRENKPWAEQLERIVELNKTLKDTPRIRAVSISLGAFSQRPQFDLWKQAVRKATESGILVVTCDPESLKLGTLRRMENRSGQEPDDYERGRYFHPGASVCVPAANRTIAGFKGPQAYTYDRTGGMSWTVPYLTGLAALAWQIDPAIEPSQMVQLWQQTAAKTAAGPVVNPAAFIEAVKQRR